MILLTLTVLLTVVQFVSSERRLLAVQYGECYPWTTTDLDSFQLAGSTRTVCPRVPVVGSCRPATSLRATRGRAGTGVRDAIDRLP